MTNEEKIKKAKGIVCKDCCCNGCSNNACPSLQETIEAIELGLAEGRKELEQWKQEWQDTQIKANEEGFARTTLQIKYAELQKENAKLREYAKFLQGTYCGIDRELAELKKENTELLESCRDKDRQLNKWFISYNEVIKENEELKKQEEIFLDRILTFQKTNSNKKGGKK